MRTAEKPGVVWVSGGGTEGVEGSVTVGLPGGVERSGDGAA